MKIKLTSVHVDDQERALRFYTVTASRIAIAKDTCGHLIQIAQLMRR